MNDDEFNLTSQITNTTNSNKYHSNESYIPLFIIYIYFI